MHENNFYNLTNPQKSIWVTEEYYKGSSINNICGTALIKEEVNFRLLEKAIYATLQNNDIFKIKFSIKDNNVVQYVSDYVNSDIVYLCAKNSKDFKKILDEIVSKPFHLLDSHPYNFYIITFPNGHAAFCLNIHHILADSWTLGFLSKQVVKTYCAYLISDIPYEYETYSYVDFIKSEEKYKKSKRYLKDKEYWNKEFETIPDIPILPGSKKISTYEEDISAERLKINLDFDFVRKIKNYCRKNNISLFNFFMAIYSIYINGVSGLNDFVIGTPILNRTNYKEKNTAGMFINMAAFRVNFSKCISFSDFIKYIASKSIAMLKHQKYSYQSLLEDLRDIHGNFPNMYNTVFSYQITNTQSKEIFVKNQTQWTFNKCSTENISIQVYDLDDTGSLDICYDYKTSIYTLDDIKNMHERLLYIVNQIINNNDIELSKIEVITPKEKKLILNKFNHTKTFYNKSLTFIDLFEKTVKKYPNKTAIIYDSEKISYKRLNEMANSVANTLSTMHNQKIAVLCKKSVWTLACFLGIMKSGNCYIPIDIEYPKDRIDYILKNSDSSLLITSKDNALADNYKNKIFIEDFYSSHNTNFTSLATPDDLAYIIYTSGTTGNPKGVKIKHKNIINTLLWRKKFYNFNKKIIVFQTFSFSFDGSITEMYTPLISGSTVVIPSSVKVDINEMYTAIQKYHINHILAVPSLYKIILREKSEILKDFKFITIAGEDFNISLVKEHFEKLPNVRLVNEYGPTENSVCTTFYELSAKNEEIYIGNPINNTKCYILDENKKILPLGVPGELYISGPGVSEGYLNNPDITKERFLKNPFDEKYMMYKTGDIVELTSNGNLKFIGRNDSQIKLHGFRIELKEIEKVILNNSNINDAIVVKKDDYSNKPILVAYVILKNKNYDIMYLNRDLKEKLPQYMIPHIVTIDKFPLTPNGKIDIKSLPIPNISTEKRNMLLPKNDIDKKIVDMVSEILNLKQSEISMLDSILSLGGDSLAAITLSSRINSVYRIDIGIKDILSDFTLQDLSNYIKSSLNINNDGINIVEQKQKIMPVAKQDFYPLSTAQKRIYYNTKMINEKNTVYNVPGGIMIDGILDKEKIQLAFEKIIERHSSLRTSFVIHESDIVQKITDRVNFQISVFQNSSSEIENIIAKFPKPFALEKAPLFRVELHYIDNAKTLLLIDSHHIVMDGHSLNNLIYEFKTLYSGKDLEALPIDYKDYSIWENNFNSSKEILPFENYWIEKFKDSDFSELNLPYDYNIPTQTSYKGIKLSKVIDKKYFSKLQDLSLKYGASPYMILLSAFFVLLYKYTGQTDINIGSPISNRTFPETEKLIGMFVNNIVVRGKINSNTSFKDFLIDIKNQVLDDFSHQPYPFDRLAKKISSRATSSRNPLFDIYFIYQNNEETTISIDGKTSTIFEIPSNTSKFDLTFEVKPFSNTINIEYRTDLFKEETIEDLYTHYLNLLDCIIADENQKISNLSILSKEEKNLIINKFNNSKIIYDKSKTISDLFEEQVIKTPNRTALVFENKKITYSVLNEKANQLANFLRDRGIKPNDIIGIMLPRSLELLISILGVLKSGACYIPIDPTYPEKRIEYMLSNSRAKFVLTTTELYNNIEFENKINIANEEIYVQNNKNLEHINSPDDLSYIIYTSGSTGLPKGVMLKHKSLTNLCNYLNKNVEFLKDNCIYKNMVSITTVSFDIFIFETLICLQKGLQIILANDDEQRIPALLDRLIKKYNGNLIQMTPSRMQIFLDNICDMPNLSNIKYVTLAGEPLPLQLRNSLINLGVKKVYNGYGPSETTVFSSFTDVTSSKQIHIGKPLGNTQFYLLDNDLIPVPIGVAGELYISGDGVGSGYLNRADLTSERYINNPFIYNSLMYKTGDLCKYDKNGNLHYLGRTDNQIKIRGLRIELEEIENKILEFNNIEKVKVIKQQVGNREIISAYFIASKKIRIAELRRHLYNVLPKYMVPSYFTPLDSFPYTPNGKIDKNALPIPTGVLQSENSNYIAPKTDLEIKMVSIWEDVLNTKPIGITDNFFELGGDSILAMNLNIKLLKITTKISYSDIFEFPTIAGLIEKMESNQLNKESEKQNNLIEKYKDILEQNFKKTNTILKNSFNNILLTGGSGFLGIHILGEYLKTEKGRIYVLLRKDPGQSVQDKLLKKLHYYFGNKFDKYLNTRIIVIEGDVSEDGFGLNQQNLFNLGNSVDAIINCAAKVSHYGNYQDFYNSNVKSVSKIIDFANLFNVEIFHISTISVSGDESLEGVSCFSEKDFYIGQNLNNVYIRSKFEAEKLILDAILNGTKAHILRLGNLMPRYSDGKFQENIDENAFIGRLKTFLKLKALPNNLFERNLELTPVDLSATAILKIVNYTNSSNIIYHIYNHNFLSIEELLKILSTLNIDIKIVDTDSFKSTLKMILEHSNTDILNTIINDLDKDLNLNYDKINTLSNDTIKFLKHCDFKWKKIDKNYIANILKLIKGD